MPAQSSSRNVTGPIARRRRTCHAGVTVIAVVVSCLCGILGTKSSQAVASEADIRHRGAHAVQQPGSLAFTGGTVAEAPRRNLETLRRHADVDKDEPQGWRGDSLSHGSLPVLPSGAVDYSSLDGSPLAVMFSGALRGTLVSEIGKDSTKPGYDGLVELFHELNDMDTKVEDLHERAARILRNLFPALQVGWIPSLWKDYLRPLVPEVLSRWWFFLMLYMFFQWFVGPIHGDDYVEIEVSRQLRELPILGALLPRHVRLPQTATFERCRCLEQTACASVCVNSCKIPSERVFKEDFGMDVHIQPNYSDFSCKWVFGKKPPPLEEDEAVMVPCFANCPAASKGTKDARKSKLRAWADEKRCKGMEVE